MVRESKREYRKTEFCVETMHQENPKYQRKEWDKQSSCSKCPNFLLLRKKKKPSQNILTNGAVHTLEKTYNEAMFGNEKKFEELQ